MKKGKLAIIMVLIVVTTAVISWRVTMHNLSIDVTDDTAYVTVFGHTDMYDYEPDF